MSNVEKLGGRSSDSSAKKLDGPQRFTYFAAQSLADDRWVCPICLDIFNDAVETTAIPFFFLPVNFDISAII